MTKINLDTSLLDKQLLGDLDLYIESLEDPSGSLITVLHKAQNLFGYLPQNLQIYIARKLKTDAARVNGVVTFYSYFIEEKPGKNIVSVCMGTACYVKGAEKVLDKVLETLHVKKGENTEDGLFTVTDVRCIGACGLAPIMSVNGKIYGHVTVDMVEGILNQYRGDKNGN